MNQLTSAAKSGAGDDAVSVASAASKGSASKAASSKQVKQALAFMQAFQMMGNLGSFLSDDSKDDESTGVCGALIGHLSPMAGVNFLAPKINPMKPETPFTSYLRLCRNGLYLSGGSCTWTATRRITPRT